MIIKFPVKLLIPVLFLPVLFTFTGCSTVESIPASEAAVLWYNLGNAYNELGKSKEAVEAYSQALTLDPQLFSAGYNLARVFIHQEKYTESAEILEELLQTDPENRIVLETRAWVYHMQGDDASALAIYNDILDKSEMNYNALYNSALILSESGQKQKALARYLRIEENYPDDYSALFYTALLFADLDEPGQALERLERLAGTEEADPSALELQGDMLVSLRRFGEAAEVYRLLTEEGDEGAPVSGDAAGRIQFKTAEILLLYIEDFSGGLEALQAAVDNGWNDSESFDRLLSDSSLEWYSAAADIITAAADKPGEDESL